MAVEDDYNPLRITVRPTPPDPGTPEGAAPSPAFAEASPHGFTRATDAPPVGASGFQRIQQPPAGPDYGGFTRALDSMEEQPPAGGPSFFDRVLKGLEPITSYPATQAHMAAEGRDQFTGGVSELFGKPREGEEEPWRLRGLANTALGPLNYTLSPIQAALRTVVGKPLEENTGIPKEYSEFAAGLALPIVGMGKVPKTVEKIFSPETVSPQAMEAAALIRQRTGIAARDTESTAAALESFQKPVNELLPAQQLGIMHYIEGGARPSVGPSAFPGTPQMRALVDTLKDAFQQRMDKLQAMPSHAQMAFIDEYFPHFWKDPAAAQAALNQGTFIKQGSGASTKGRTIPTIQEGINRGLEPITTNPIDATLMYVTSMDKFIATQEILNTAKDSGTIIYRHPTAMGASGNPNSVKNIPPGYVKLEGRASAGPGGDAFAPEDWARVYNNFISPGITGPWRGVYDMARRGTNAVTQTLLSLSGYHAFTMAEADMSSQVARAIRAARGGNVGEAMVEASKYAVSPLVAATRHPAKGAYLRDVYLGKQMPITPQDREIVDLITQAGGRMARPSHALDYESSALGDFLTSFRRGRLRMELAEQGKEIKVNPISGTAKAVASNIGRLMDTMNKPLFQHYIPAMKNSAAYEDMAQFLKQNPAASPAEKLAEARRVVDRIDNRFGEMINDNVFWNKTQKQIAMLSMLSYSWNMGGAREIGGGLRDIARTAVGRGEWTPKADYVVGMTINWGIMSAVYQYLKTGQGPQSIHDLAAPRTGGEDRSGEPERIIPPGIMKDVFGYSEHFGQEVLNKLNPGVKIGFNTMSILGGQGGSDWRGDPILSPRSPGETALAKTPEWLAEYFNFIIKAATPIQVQNITRGNEEGSNINSFEKALGIRKAPRSLVDPEGYEHMLNNLWSRKQRNKLRHENVEKQRYGGTE